MPYRSLFSRYRTLSRYTPHKDSYRIDICLHTERNKGGIARQAAL